MIGLEKGTVKLAPHNELWHELFAQEEARMRDAIGEHVIAIEHVGSTAICGLSAKPIGCGFHNPTFAQLTLL